jgi:DNA-binding MarR family transcriptional regulator
MDLSQLLGFVRMGDYVASLLKDALHESGLNLTQAMICWHLHVDKTPGGLSLTDLSRFLAASPSRVQVQLKQLVAHQILELGQIPDSDQRVQRYVLSRKGKRQIQVFVHRAGDARGVLWEKIFSGDRERIELSSWSRIYSRLTKPLAITRPVSRRSKLK